MSTNEVTYIDAYYITTLSVFMREGGGWSAEVYDSALQIMHSCHGSAFLVGAWVGTWLNDPTHGFTRR